MVPDEIPSIYNGEKTVIYGLLMDKSNDKGRDELMCKAILSGDRYSWKSVQICDPI